MQQCFVGKGMIADLAVHQPDKSDGGISNPHFHVMTTIRPLNPDGTWGAKQRREYLLDDNGKPVLDKNGNPKFNAVPTTDWGRPETLEEWRMAWCEMVNNAFEKKGLDVCIDHRSYERQGLDLIPTVHEGPSVRQMESKGIVTDKGELNRWIKATNRLLSEIKGRIKSLFSWIAEVKEELSKSETPNLVNMLSDCYSERNAAAYSQRGKTLNLKEYSETVNYLRDNNIFSIEELQSRLSDVNASFNTLSDSLKAKSARMKELQELIRQGENYFCLKPVHDELNGIKWKKQREHLKADHDSELRLFYLARRILREKLSGKPVTVKDWQREYESLKAEYAELSKQHKPLRDELIKLRGVQYHVNRVLSEHTEERRPQAKTHEGR